jgi:hypothetical protein
MMNAALSLMIFAIAALLGGSFYLWRRGGTGKQVALMLVLAVVLAVNVAIWTLPGAGGTAPIAATPN